MRACRPETCGDKAEGVLRARPPSLALTLTLTLTITRTITLHHPEHNPDLHPKHHPEHHLSITLIITLTVALTLTLTNARTLTLTIALTLTLTRNAKSSKGLMSLVAKRMPRACTDAEEEERGGVLLQPRRVQGSGFEGERTLRLSIMRLTISSVVGKRLLSSFEYRHNGTASFGKNAHISIAPYRGYLRH